MMQLIMEHKHEGGGGGATDRLRLRALAFPICSQGFIARVYHRALVNTRRHCFPGLDELPSSFRCAISNY